MQVLKSIENRFNSCSLFFKLIIFLIPALFFLFSFSFLEDKTTKKDLPINLLNPKTIKMKENLFDTLKKIEQFSIKNGIYLESIINNKSSIKIIAVGSLKNRIILFDYLENYNSFSKIDSFELYGNSMIIKVTFNKFYKKEKSKLLTFLEDFKEKKESKLKLQAIIDGSVYIDDKWFSLGDKIGIYTISKINKTEVILKNRYETKSLSLVKDESL